MVKRRNFPPFGDVKNIGKQKRKQPKVAFSLAIREIETFIKITHHKKKSSSQKLARGTEIQA